MSQTSSRTCQWHLSWGSKTNNAPLPGCSVLWLVPLCHMFGCVSLCSLGTWADGTGAVVAEPQRCDCKVPCAQQVLPGEVVSGKLWEPSSVFAGRDDGLVLQSLPHQGLSSVSARPGAPCPSSWAHRSCCLWQWLRMALPGGPK